MHFLYYTRSFNKQHNLNVSAGWEGFFQVPLRVPMLIIVVFRRVSFIHLNYAAEVYKKPTRTENTTRRVSVLLLPIIRGMIFIW